MTATNKIRLASKNWSRLSQEFKDSWAERSKSINNLPIIGQFEALPTEATNAVILKAIKLEYDKFVSLMHRALKRPLRFIDSVIYKTFGKERITRRSEIFRCVHLNHILKIIFFGSNYYHFSSNEIVHRTKACVVIHINSKQRMIEVFERNEVCAFLVEGDNDTNFSCAGRVTVRKKEQG